MAISRKKKEEIVETVKNLIKDSNSVIFTDYRGLTVEEMTELRKELRSKNITFKVMKQTLLEIAAQEAGAELDFTSIKNHPIAIAFGLDEVEPAKAIYEFTKKNEKLELIGGAINGRSVSLDQIKALAQMPSREEMYASIVGSLASPLRGLAAVIQGNLRGLVSVLAQYQENKG